MKTNKVTKLGVSLLSVAALGVVAPILIDVPVFGVSIVKAEETRLLEYLIVYYDKDTGEEIAPPKTGTINPGEIVNIYKDIDGYQVVSNYEWMPGFNASYRIMSEYFGFSKGRQFMFLDYKKVNADAKPSDTPKPEEKPETKPSETPKPGVKPETKPSETPKPEVKPSEKPEAEEQQKPLKYRIDYIGESGEKVAPSEFGVLNPGETVNIYKDIEGHEVVSRFEWLPGYNMDYDTLSTYSGSVDGYNYMYLKYKKLDPAPAPTPKPEVKPETKPSDTPKPEVKPSEKPEAEAKEQEPIKYRIRYLDEHSREIAPMYTGVLNPGESVNIYKDIEGHQVVSNFSWMPGYDLTYNIASTYFYGAKDGYLEGYLRYKKLDPTPTPKPEVKPETKPSDTPKPEVKPEPAPKEEEKQEPLKYRITYYDIETRETLGQMTGVINPGQTINIYKKFNGHEIISKDSWMPNYDMTYDIVNEYFYGSADGYNDLHLEYKKVEEPTPEPAPTPTPTPEPAPTPTPIPEPEVKPAPKPSDTSKPEVKPELKPQTNSNTAPTAPVKPVGQTSNSKADKPTSKKETPALPNTGEQSSSLSLVGLLLASLGLAGLTYKGRH